MPDLPTLALKASNSNVVLQILLAFFYENPEQERVDPSKFSEFFFDKLQGATFPRGMRSALRRDIENTINKLRDTKIINIRTTASGSFIYLNSKAFSVQIPPEEKLENIIFPEQDSIIPASDRVVRIDDNSPEKRKAMNDIEDLVNLLKKNDNDVDLTHDERNIAVSELNPLITRLQSGWIRIGELTNAVTKGSPLVWLVDKLGGTAIAAAATTAIVSLGILLKSLVG